jgi:hypothetical protein
MSQKAPIVKAETGILLDEIGRVDRAEIQYVAKELESFCQIQAATEAVRAGPEFLQKGDTQGLIKLLKDATLLDFRRTWVSTTSTILESTEDHA